MKNSVTSTAFLMFLAALAVFGFGCTTYVPVYVPGDDSPPSRPVNDEPVFTPAPPRSEADPPPASREEPTPPPTTRRQAAPTPPPAPRQENIVWVCSDASTPSESYEVVELAEAFYIRLTFSEDSARELLTDHCRPLEEGKGFEASGVINPVVIVQVAGDCTKVSYSFEADDYGEKVHVVHTNNNNSDFTPVGGAYMMFRFNHLADPICLVAAAADYEMTVKVRNEGGHDI